MKMTIDMGYAVIRKAMAFALAAFFCVVVVTTSTFAWGYMINALSEWFNITDQNTAILQKYERDAEGIATTHPIFGAHFRLFCLEGESEDTTRTQIGGVYFTNDEGIIEVTGLLSGRYVFVEVQPAFGYGFDLDPITQVEITEYFFTLPSAARSNPDVVVYNQKIEAPLTVTKTVHNQNGTSVTLAQREKEFTYLFEIDPGRSLVSLDLDRAYTIDIFDTITPDNPPISSQTIKSGETFALRHGHQAHIQDIPVGAYYIIEEIPEPYYAVSTVSNQGTQTIEGSEVLFTNTCQNDLLGSLTLNKHITGIDSDEDDEFTFEIVLGTSGTPQFTPSSVTFMRQRTGSPLTSVETTVTRHVPPSTYSATFTIKASETVTFENLPIGTTYTLREIDTGGYTSDGHEVSGTITSPTGKTLDITNHKGEVPPTDWEIDITKTLTDLSQDSSADLAKLFEFTIIVSEDGTTPGYSEGTITHTIISPDAADITGTIPKDTGRATLAIRAGDRIAITGESTCDIHYEVSENNYNFQHYFASPQSRSGIVRPAQHIELLWENTFRPPLVDDPVTLRITKEVDTEQKDPLYAFEFELIIEGEAPRHFTLVAGETKSFETTIGAHYIVRELLSSQDGYVLVRVINGQGTVTPDLIVEGVTFTNRYTRPITIDIEGEKIWDSRGLDVAQPESIEVHLIDERLGTIVARQTVTAADGWLFTFTNIDKYDADGVEIPYTVSEVPLKQYASSVTRNPQGYFTILNTYIAPVTVTTPQINKRVNLASAPDASFNFMLEALDGAPLPLGGIGATRTISITGAGTGQFGSITFVEEGIYRYLIREIAGTATGFTYDRSTYELTYIVTLEDIEGKPQLVPVATLKHTTTGAEESVATFVNTYVRPEGPEEPKEPDPTDPGTDPREPSSIGKTGDARIWAPWLLLCLIAVGTVVFATQIRRRSI